eukprot:SAG31_NODE_6884_length_1861_cov_1.061862_2_plen_116_part_00
MLGKRVRSDAIRRDWQERTHGILCTEQSLKRSRTPCCFRTYRLSHQERPSLNQVLLYHTVSRRRLRPFSGSVESCHSERFKQRRRPGQGRLHCIEKAERTEQYILWSAVHQCLTL